MDFLADDQLRSYGRFRGDLSQSQLDRFFLLDHVDRRMVERHRRDHQRLGFAMQLGTVRFLGTFLSDPLDVPWQVVEYLAEQLRIRDPSCVKRYGNARRRRPATVHARRPPSRGAHAVPDLGGEVGRTVRQPDGLRGDPLLRP